MSMRDRFKNRGHYCNYCRKILSNKCPEFNHEYINYAIWYFWEYDENMLPFIRDLKTISYDPTKKHVIRYFNTQLKEIIAKHMGGGNGMNLECSTRCMFDVTLLTLWYKSLWLKYLDSNPEFVEFASRYSTFTDVFSGKGSLNSQADVIRQYIKDGRASLAKEYRPFFDLLGVAKAIPGKIWTLQDVQNVLVRESNS